MQFAPLAHPQVRQEILAAPLHQLFVGQAFISFALEAVPNIQVGEEIGLLVGKAFVRFVGGFARFERAFTRVLDGQGGHNHQHFLHAIVFLRGQQHTGNFRVDGQARHLFAEFGELVLIAHRPQFQQHLKTIIDITLVGRFEKRKFGHIA